MFRKINFSAILLFGCAVAFKVPLEFDSTSLSVESGQDSPETLLDVDSDEEYWDTVESGEGLSFSHPDLGAFNDPFVLNASKEYPIEEHFVTTRDGYILKMHRIPSSAMTSNITVRRPVFLMHGLLDSSAGWVLSGHTAGLAYILADLGYDVWMGNARGNRYSRNHTIWNPKGSKNERRSFWDFSWHQIGTVDLPAMIDYTLSVSTRFKKMHYIAHSQGTTAFFVMCSELPQYNSKILLVNALAPIAYMTHVKSPLAKFIAKGLDNSEVRHLAFRSLSVDNRRCFCWSGDRESAGEV